MRNWAALIILVLGIGLSLWWRAKTIPAPATEKPNPKTSAPSPLENETEAVQNASPLIRVCLTNSARDSFSLLITHPCQVFVGDSETAAATLQPTETALIVSPNSSGDGIQIGENEFSTIQIRLATERSPNFWINEHQYRGEIHFHLRKSKRLLAVNHVPLEAYLGSVVDSEMPATFPDEARKAQAIIARTYALYRMQEMKDNNAFDLFASTRSQQYLGVQYKSSNGRRLAGESTVSRRLVHETNSLVCLHNQKLFCAYYSAVCGGKTTRGTLLFPDAVPLLKSVLCQFCEAADYYQWNKTYSRKRASELLSQAFSKQGHAFGELDQCENLDSQPGPTALYRFHDGRTSRTLNGQAIRNIFPGLPSPTFTLTLTENDLVFDGAGHGHGVGLCQWGARGMAIENKTATEILSHYYPGVEIAPYQYDDK